MIRRSLDAIREKIRAEMQAGAEFCWRDVLARADDASDAWAHGTLRNWHRAGETHVVRWVRGRQGPAVRAVRAVVQVITAAARKIPRVTRLAREQYASSGPVIFANSHQQEQQTSKGTT